MEDQRQEDDADPRWRVGAEHIKQEDLMLVGLQRVSMGSWQAHFRLVGSVSQGEPISMTFWERQDETDTPMRSL